MDYRDSIELSIIHSIYKNKVVYQKLESGELYPEKREVLVKQIKVKKWFLKEAIVSVEQYVNSRNKITPNRSVIFDKFSGKFYATFHSPQEIVENINSITKTSPIGFLHEHPNIHPTKSQIREYRTRRS
jgi:hypothetical protein